MPCFRPRRPRTALVTALLLAAGALLPARAARAQEAAIIEALAPVLAAEDARDFRPELFRRALSAPDSLVRIKAALAVGRIGDPAGTPLLLRLVDDPDTTVRPYAAFALGLLADSAAVRPLIARLSAPPALDDETAAEVITALAKSGGREVADFFAQILRNAAPLPREDRTRIVQQVLLESWRLGRQAPVTDIVPFASDTSLENRWRAVYTLSRTRSPAGANALQAAVRSADPLVRSFAVRALTRSYADSTGIAPTSLATLVATLIDDPESGTRINALRSLGTFALPAYGARVASHLGDQSPHAQVQAAEALGHIGGPDAVAALRRALAGRLSFAVQREALLGLARADTAAFTAASASWATSSDWRARAVAAEGTALADKGGVRLGRALADRDGRVVGAALTAWNGAVEGPKPDLVSAARPLLRHPDPVVRSAAAEALARAADPADVAALTDTYRGTTRDSIPDAAQSALNALLAIYRSGAAGHRAAETGFLLSSSRPSDYLLRRWAEQNWPELADRWGPAYPIETGRTLADYRDIVRRFVLPSGTDRATHVLVETDQRGIVELELFGADAPLTVSNFLRLLDRRFFDGNRWHRVVPNFVIQDGDPRGDGNGGPGGAIRDELNRHRYDSPVLGMALSGPDTGSSQWFINLSPQPHLDGTYTVFGRVVGGSGSLYRIVQGDQIRTIRRQ